MSFKGRVKFLAVIPILFLAVSCLPLDDTAPPEFASANVEASAPDQVVVIFNEPVISSGSGFAIKINGTPVGIEGFSRNATDTFIFTIDQDVVADDIGLVTIEYDDTVGDTADIPCFNPLASFDEVVDSFCDDVDEDGVCDGDDNCVDVANSDQLDQDNDGKGDLCDCDTGDDLCTAAAYCGTSDWDCPQEIVPDIYPVTPIVAIDAVFHGANPTSTDPSDITVLTLDTAGNMFKDWTIFDPSIPGGSMACNQIGTYEYDGAGALTYTSVTNVMGFFDMDIVEIYDSAYMFGTSGSEDLSLNGMKQTDPGDGSNFVGTYNSHSTVHQTSPGLGTIVPPMDVLTTTNTELVMYPDTSFEITVTTIFVDYLVPANNSTTVVGPISQPAGTLPPVLYDNGDTIVLQPGPSFERQ